MTYSRIAGTGSYLPEKVVTNQDLEKTMDTSDEWIRERTGIKRRHIAADDETTSDIAVSASLRAIEAAGIAASDIDLILVGTTTPDKIFPGTACIVQRKLGISGCGAFDLQAACSGFIYGLDTADRYIRTGGGRNVLVVGAETLSRLTNWEDRTTAVLFGDGAGAVVLGPGEGRPSLLDVVAGTDGSMTSILTLSTGGTRNPFTLDVARSGAHQHLEMNGREVFKNAVARMSAAVEDVLGRISRPVDEVALLIPHQANKRIIDAVGRKLGFDKAKTFVNVDRFGNTGSASVPLALWQAREAGLIESGDLVVLTAFGAGFHWAAAAVQF